MKKVLLLIILNLIIGSVSTAEAHYCYSNYYVTYKDYYQEEQNFHNCNKHTLLKETTVYYYSNGTRRSYITSTIFNQDGNVLESGCSDVKHIIYNKKHYFTFYKNKKYQIMDEYGNYLTSKKYKSLKEIAPNRLLVKLDKKYGVISLEEEIITPIKYQKFEFLNSGLFMTKLNGYYGLIDNRGEVLAKNEYDKIKPVQDCFLLKKYDKYLIADSSGKFLFDIEFDNVKTLGEYIIIEKNNKQGILDSSGNMIADILYKKIRLERNTLEGKIADNSWHVLQ